MPYTSTLKASVNARDENHIRENHVREECHSETMDSALIDFDPAGCWLCPEGGHIRDHRHRRGYRGILSHRRRDQQDDQPEV